MRVPLPAAMMTTSTGVAMRFPVIFKGRVEQLSRIIGLLAVTCLLGACGVMKLAYNQADELAYWRLDSYFDLSDAQSPLVREELARVHQWHRRTQLPLYQDMLQKWQLSLAGDMDEAQTCRMYEEARHHLLSLSTRAETAAVHLAGTLAPEQLDNLKRKFSKVNREYRKDFLDGKAQDLLDKRVKKAASRAEMLYGPLEERQLAVLRSRIAQSAFNPAVSLAEQQRRQQDALSTLAPLVNNQAGPEQARAPLQGYFARLVNSPDPAYRSYLQRLTRDNCKTFADLHNSTTATQRAKAVQTVVNYQQDFRLLAAQRP
jgi:uncharacterized membrane protein